MTERVDCYACAKIEIFVSVCVPHVRAFSVGQNKVGAIVHGKHVLLKARYRGFGRGGGFGVGSMRWCDVGLRGLQIMESMTREFFFGAYEDVRR